MGRSKWEVKTRKHTEPLVPSGYETRVYRDGKVVGKALGRTPKESTDLALDRALKKSSR